MRSNPLETIFCIILRSRHQSGVDLRGMIRNRVWGNSPMPSRGAHWRAGLPVNALRVSRMNDLTKPIKGHAPRGGRLKPCAGSALLAKGRLAQRPFAIRNKNELRLYT
jgi:hypothetical protein